MLQEQCQVMQEYHLMETSQQPRKKHYSQFTGAETATLKF